MQPPAAHEIPDSPVLGAAIAGALALERAVRRRLRRAAGRTAHPSAAIMDRRTLPSTPDSGGRAGDDGAKRKKGSKVHLAVETLGPRRALQVTPADAQDRAQIDPLAAAIPNTTGENVEIAFVDQAETGQAAADHAAAHGIRRVVVKTPEAKRGLILLPRRWVVERGFAWTARCRRFVRDDERLPETLAGLHLLAFAASWRKISSHFSLQVPDSL
jgi:transposase